MLLVGALNLLTRPPARADYVTDLLPVMLLVAGSGLALPALTALGMSGTRAEDAGLASGLFNTTQQVGMALGVAVLSTLAAARGEALGAAGHGRAEALTGGYTFAFAAGAGLMVAALVVTLLALRRLRPQHSAVAGGAARAPVAARVTAA